MNNKFEDFTTSLSREELVAYYDATNNQIMNIIKKTIEEQNQPLIQAITAFTSSVTDAIKNIGALYNNDITALNNNITKIASQIQQAEEARTAKLIESHSQINNSIADVSEKIKNAAENSRKQTWAIYNSNKSNPANQINPVFYSSYTKVQQADWIEIVKGSITKKCRDYKLNKGNIYHHIYSQMRQKYDLDDLLFEYKKTFNIGKADMIDMIAASDVLRACFTVYHDRYIKHIIRNDGKNQVNNKNNIIRINSIVSKLSPTGKKPGRIYSKAYAIVNSANNIDIQAVAKEFAKKKKLRKTMSTPMIISYSNELTDKFCMSIEKYLEGKNNG